MRSACVLVLLAAASLALGVVIALADPGGNSGAAHQCKQTSGNHGDCVSDAAKGGTPAAASEPTGGTGQGGAVTASPSAPQAVSSTASAVAKKGVAAAAKANRGNKGGNSAAAHQCQHSGWKNLVRADQTRFKNAGACVSYAAHGGTPAAPKPKAQALCESFGGVYTPGSGNILWFCAYVGNRTIDAFGQLAAQCVADVLAQFPGSDADLENLFAVEVSIDGHVKVACFT
jgi:hypothetical protein